jgi:hypothetical protein
MAKLLTQRNVLVALASFILVWYVVVHRNVSEHMTGVPRLSEAEKTEVMKVLFDAVMPNPNALAPVPSDNGKKLLAFLDQNQITKIDDKFMKSLREIVKLLAEEGHPVAVRYSPSPDDLKKAVRTVGKMIIALLIGTYADTYEKLKEPPTETEFRLQLIKSARTDNTVDRVLNIIELQKTAGEHAAARIAKVDEEIKEYRARIAREMSSTEIAAGRKSIEANLSYWENSIKRDKLQVKTTNFTHTTVGPEPLNSSSPIMAEIISITYKYYFGSPVTQANIISGAATAAVATLGSLGTIAVVAVIVYFVFLR